VALALPFRVNHTTSHSWQRNPSRCARGARRAHGRRAFVSHAQCPLLWNIAASRDGALVSWVEEWSACAHNAASACRCACVTLLCVCVCVCDPQQWGPLFPLLAHHLVVLAPSR